MAHVDVNELDPEKTVVVATGNPHKVTEIEAILAPAWEGFEAGCVARMSDFDVASPVEDGVTFEENSLLNLYMFTVL